MSERFLNQLIFGGILLSIFIITPVLYEWLKHIRKRKDQLPLFLKQFSSLTGVSPEDYSEYDITVFEGNYKGHNISASTVTYETDRFQVTIKCNIPSLKSKFKIWLIPVKREYYNNSTNCVKTGDDSFDNTYLFTSKNRTRATAVLNRDIRKLMSVVALYNFEIEAQGSELYLAGPASDIDTWQICLDNMIRIAELIFSTTPTEQLLIKAIESESLAGSRLICLQYLINDYFINDLPKKARPFLINLLGDPDLEIILLISRIMPVDAIKTILARTDLDTLNSTLIEKISNLFLKRPSITGVKKRLYKWLTSENSDYFDKVINALSIHPYSDTDRQIVALIKNHINNDYSSRSLKKFYFSTSCINYFTKNPSLLALDWLHSELKSTHDSIVIETIGALTNIHSISSVEYLLPLTKGFENSEIKHAARTAIQIIQSQVPDEEKGGLSISKTDNDEGQLSLPEDREGKKGKLSMENANDESN